MKKRVRKLAVLASGYGSTLQAVIKAILQKELDMEINLVVSDNPNAFALIFAETASIKTHILTSNTAKKRDEELLNVLKEVYVRNACSCRSC